MKKLLLVICILFNFNVLAQKSKKDSIRLDSIKTALAAIKLNTSSNNYAPNFAPLSPNAASFQNTEIFKSIWQRGFPTLVFHFIPSRKERSKISSL
jgi:hypothetical protein